MALECRKKKYAVLSSIKKPSTDRISVEIFYLRERLSITPHIENALKIESVIKKKYTRKLQIKNTNLYKISKNKNKTMKCYIDC